MTIQSNEVTIGAYYIAKTNQLRKVISIANDDKKRIRINYISKSIKYPNRPFNYCHTKSNPPLLETFISDCVKKLDNEEIRELRINSIILENE